MVLLKSYEILQGVLLDGCLEDEDKLCNTIDKESVSFSNKELQVMTKIVDHTLQPQQTYEGLWHAEGTSDENIVMTGEYFLTTFHRVRLDFLQQL